MGLDQEPSIWDIRLQFTEKELKEAEANLERSDRDSVADHDRQRTRGPQQSVSVISLQALSSKMRANDRVGHSDFHRCCRAVRETWDMGRTSRLDSSAG